MLSNLFGFPMFDAEVPNRDTLEPEVEPTVSIIQTTTTSIIMTKGNATINTEQTVTKDITLPLSAVKIAFGLFDDDADSEDEDVEGHWALNLSFTKVPSLMRFLMTSIARLCEKYAFDWEIIEDNDKFLTVRLSSSNYDAVSDVAKQYGLNDDNIYRLPA